MGRRESGRTRGDVSDRPLHLLPNLGPKTAEWLGEVGIHSEADLRAIGAPAAYRRLKHWNAKRVSLNALWGIYGALNNVPWNKINAETKARLLADAGEQPR